MSKKSSRIGKIPTFVKKLVQILEDEEITEIISWLSDGNGFKILSASLFADKVLPKHFKHNNMASFVRQLNMYGFNRPKQSNQNVYIHPRFQKGNLNNMKFIRRNSTRNTNTDQQNSNESYQNNKSLSENSRKQLMMEYERVIQQNQQLKKENLQLTMRLNHFEQIKQKLRKCTEEMNRYIAQSLQQAENEKAEKQANQSNSSSNKTSLDTKTNFKSGFSIYNKNNFASNQLNYQILLQGSPKVEQIQK